MYFQWIAAIKPIKKLCLQASRTTAASKYGARARAMSVYLISPRYYFEWHPKRRLFIVDSMGSPVPCARRVIKSSERAGDFCIRYAARNISGRTRITHSPRTSSAVLLGFWMRLSCIENAWQITTVTTSCSSGTAKASTKDKLRALPPEAPIHSIFRSNQISTPESLQYAFQSWHLASKFQILFPNVSVLTSCVCYRRSTLCLYLRLSTQVSADTTSLWV